MRILLTHERFPPDCAGGGEVFVSSLARHLNAHGVSIRILTTGDPAQTSFHGMPMTRLPIHRYRFALAVRDIVRLARDVDLIHTFNYHAALPSLSAASWLGKPIVCGILGLFGSTWKEMRGPLVGRAFLAWEKHLVRRHFDLFLFLSEYSRDVAVELGMPPDRAVVNPMGLDLEEDSEPAPKEDVVLFVGRLCVRKGIHDVLAVARALPSVRFRVIGWGAEEMSVRSSAPGNVEVKAMPDGVTLGREFARARIFLLPSRAEGSPVALAQAMASGCAVVCTLPFTFEGMSATVGDRDGLIQAVRWLWQHPEETARMGQRNRELARSYDWNRHATSLIALYARLLPPGGANRAAHAVKQPADCAAQPTSTNL